MPLQSVACAAGTVENLLAELDGRIKATFVFFRVPQQDAEDLLQDALLALVTKSSEIRSPDLWLLQTVRNHCASYWRRRRRWIYEELDQALQSEEGSDDQPELGRQEWRCDLRNAIARLPERCKSILHLRYGLGCETNEMADRLGYREGSVRKAELRCLSALTREITGPETAGS